MDANKKFKLLGFNHSGELSANIMVLSTGKMIHMDLKELVDSEISDDLSRHELNALYKKLYAGKDITTAYDLSDRNERSWYAYLLITVMLSVIYIFFQCCRFQTHFYSFAEHGGSNRNIYLPVHLHTGRYSQ